MNCECAKGVAARDHEIAALKRIIENGRAAHNEDRVARDWLARDRDEWKARANEFEAQVEMLEARAEADLINAEAAIARATQAEAQAAAMRARVGELLSQNGCDCECGCDSDGHDSECERCFACRVEEAIAADAGRTLLAELEALREVATTGEAFARIVADGYMTWPETEAFRAAIARWKPLRGDK